MKNQSRYIAILTLLFGYVLLQFIWWEILLVRQTSTIINEQQKLAELSISNADTLNAAIQTLHHKKKMQIVMIVSEGTVFLLLLLFGIYKIKQAHDKEIALNRQQNNFFLSITHELKTPIAATKLQLQTLQKQQLDDNTRQELVTNALAETERLNLLIDNVLLASSLDKGQMQFNPERLNISIEVQRIAQRYYKAEKEKGKLILQLSENAIVNIDSLAFPSIITNLISNAFKYSKESPSVQVAIKSNDKKVWLTVSDNGCGIADKDKEKIFERFYRAGNEETRNSKGTGLGLYIVKYILVKHGATVSVKNNYPVGSIFEIEFHAA